MLRWYGVWAKRVAQRDSARFTLCMTAGAPAALDHCRVVAGIGIGVGANTGITSVLDTVLLNPLGIRNANGIVAATVYS